MKRRALTPISDEIAPTYRFADLCFRPGQGLFRNNLRLPVPPKETQLLELLLRAEGDVVSQATIEQALWPRQDVHYDSLARCVYSLRKILRQSGVDCVQTVSKHGYRITESIHLQHPGRHQPARLDAVETSSTPAYSYYLSGLREASIPSPEKLSLAIRFLQKSVALDPTYDAALALIADVTMYQCVRGYLPPEKALMQAQHAYLTALAHNPSHVPSRVAKAWFKGMIGQNLDEGLAILDEALEDDPDYAPGYAHRSWFSRARGDAKAAVLDQREGAKLNPEALLNRHGLAFTLFHSLNVQEAIELETELAQNYPDDDTTHTYLAVFEAYMGREKEALEAATRGMALSADIPGIVANIAYVEATVGSRSRAGELVRFALENKENRSPRPHIAPALCALGRESEAISLMMASKQEHCPWFYGMRTDPRIAAIVNEDRLVRLYE
ncbi:hypothetical protein FV139_12980 [Parahaliea maris]|uniref:OmpR/PhoB-type domain-containing protein n=1 Tax=Parahaliea maris TaxID=2716870 RepID=A0A5C8ZWE6_9GAMM|nr:winged helix-turn-helix domain-containing protein [Parahaliea maris]TXS92873.1 hypothetical protein FV139_12980 [Parahaliea maris]